MLTQLRLPLQIPTGAMPGIDARHVASQGIRFSAVAASGNMHSMLGVHRGTLVGAPTAGHDGNIGRFLKFTSSSTSLTFAGNSTVADTVQTLACICVVNTFTAFGGLVFSSTATTSGIYLNQNSTTTVLYGQAGGTNISLTVAPAMTAGQPYFMAISIMAGAANFVARNLRTGQLHTGTDTTGFTITAPNGTWGLGGIQGAAGTTSIAAAMGSAVFLSLQQLIAWSADPWSFWYPILQADENRVGLSATTAALLARSFAMASGRASSIGAVPIAALSIAQARGRAAPSGSTALLARSVGAATGRLASGAYSVAMSARGTAAAQGSANPSGNVLLAAAGKAMASGRNAISAVANLVALSASGTAMAAGRASMSASAALRATGIAAGSARNAMTGAAALSARAAAMASGRLASGTYSLALAARSIAMAQGHAPMIERLALHAVGSGMASGMAGIAGIANFLALAAASAAMGKGTAGGPNGMVLTGPGVGQFTVSGLGVVDLFDPVTGVSYLWSPTQRRTV